MTTNIRVVDIIKRIPKNYHYTTFYVAIVVTMVLLLQIITLAKGWR